MPRDGTYTPDDDILDTLISARAKFTGPESWFKGGNEPFNGSRYSNCIGTALSSFSETPEAEFLLDLIGRDKGYPNLAVWNNTPMVGHINEHRTYEDVIDLLDRAIKERRALVMELVA